MLTCYSGGHGVDVQKYQEEEIRSDHI